MSKHLLNQIVVITQGITDKANCQETSVTSVIC
jgi:hypothetical protein